MTWRPSGFGDHRASGDAPRTFAGARSYRSRLRVPMILLGHQRCPLCDEVLREGEALVSTWGVFLSKEDPLVDLCDAGLHAACAARWSERERFCRAWFEAMRRSVSRNPFWSVVWERVDAFVSTNPSPIVAEVEVMSARAFSRWRVKLADWDAQREAPRSTHESEAAVIGALWPDLRSALPDAATLLSRVDRDELVRRQGPSAQRRDAREEALRLRSFNRAARRCVEALRGHGLTCPHCGELRVDHRFLDGSSGRRGSCFVCGACSKRFTHEDLSPAS